MTPIQEAIAFMDENWSESEIDSDDWLRLIYSRLQSLLPKEKEFVGKVFEKGADIQDKHTHPEGGCGFNSVAYDEDKTEFLNQLYPKP